ncbi:hypothetical protein D3C80_1540140 [compost metagenome]
MKSSAGLSWFQPLTLPLLSERISTWTPLCSRADFGPVSSTCSKPSVTRMATRLPFNARGMSDLHVLQDIYLVGPDPALKFLAAALEVVRPAPCRVKIAVQPRVCTYVPRAFRRADPAGPARHQCAAPTTNHGGFADGAVHARPGSCGHRPLDFPGPWAFRSIAEDCQFALLRPDQQDCFDPAGGDPVG